MKKLILSLGSAVAVIVPVVSVISCNKGDTSSNLSDKNTGTNTSNSGVQASEHKYPELTDSLRAKLTGHTFLYTYQPGNSTIDDYHKLKGEEYFKQFESHLQDADFKQNYLVFYPGPNQWVAPYHEIYDYFHNLDSDAANNWNNNRNHDDLIDPITGNYLYTSIVTNDKGEKVTTHVAGSSSGVYRYPYLDN